MPDYNLERLIPLIEQVVSEIYAEVGSYADLVDDSSRKRMFESVLNLLNQLGLTLEEVVPQGIASAFADGYAEGGSLLIDEGMDSVNVKGNLTAKPHLSAIQELAQGTGEDLQAAIRTAGIVGMGQVNTLLQEVQDLIAKSEIKGLSNRTITKYVQRKFIEAGLTSFITSDNRKLPLDFYAKTVVRTKRKEANTHGANARYIENGVTLIQITEHHPTCDECASRQGLILSLTGEHEGVPTADRVGLPPFHPNCQHTVKPIISLEGRTVRPFRPNRDPRTESQKQLYKHEQAIRRKANEEKKLYMKMKAENVEGLPATIGAFRRLKRKDDQSWKNLQQAYKREVKKIPT